MLLKRGYQFHTDTDTEAVAVLCKYVWDSQPHKRLNFTELIKTVIKELVSQVMAVGSTHIIGRLLCVRFQIHSFPR